MNIYKLQQDCYQRGYEAAEKKYHIQSKWIDTPGGKKCDRCEGFSKYESEYCPICGAHMILSTMEEFR